MTIKIYKDITANAIFIEDSNGAQFLNSLQATVLGDSCSVEDTAKGIGVVSGLLFSEFVDQSDNTYGGTAVEVCDALNSIFSSSGTPTNNVPVITSPLSISSVVGEVINYELETSYGVGYEWDNLPAGLTTVEGNVRKLIGGSSLLAGTYTPTMRAINYNGEDAKTLTVIVSDPPFSNTKSVRFDNNDYLDATATVANPMYRASNGSGSSDAWSVSFWFLAGTSGNGEQTILMFGGSDQDNEGRVQLFYDASGGDKHIRLLYGTNNNNLEFETPNNGIQQGVWNHMVVTYDGGTTGQSQGSLNNYYNRFGVFINGVGQTLNKDHKNYGWSGSIKAEYFRVGRNGSTGNYLRNGCLLDELAIWSSDQTANASAIYNSGVPSNLNALGTPPDHWWRTGDGDTYPTLLDSVGSTDFTMTNMTSADIVNNVP